MFVYTVRVRGSGKGGGGGGSVGAVAVIAAPAWGNPYFVFVCVGSVVSFLFLFPPFPSSSRAFAYMRLYVCMRVFRHHRRMSLIFTNAYICMYVYIVVELQSMLHGHILDDKRR